MGVTMVSMIGSETILPIFVQNLLHRSALDSGLTLLPGAIVMAFMSMTSGALYEKFGPRKLAFSRYGDCCYYYGLFCCNG